MSTIRQSSSIDDLRINGSRLGADVIEVVTSADIVETMAGASTLDVTLRDPSRRLLRSGFVAQAPLDADVDGLTFRHVATDKSDDDLRLTFEDLTVALLRRYKKPRKAFRDVMTRAQFAQLLVREVKEKRIAFHSPSLKKRQPIVSSTQQTTQDQRDEAREPGFADGAPVKVKRVTATTEQRSLMTRALNVAISLNAPKLAMLALLVAGTQESGWQNLTHGHSSSVGLLQLLDIHGSVAYRRDVERVVNLFLTRGFTGEGSAIQLAKDHPDWSPSQVAEKVQGNAGGAADYQPWEEEASANLDLFFGEDGPPSSGGTVTQRARYEFTRGKPGELEDSWTALVRLAQEVGWRCFTVRGVVYFISDVDLMRSRPVMRVTEEDEGVDRINFRWDSGRAVDQATVLFRVGRWRVPPGSVVEVYDMGPANGRWLVYELRRSLFSIHVEAQLVRPTKPLPEPTAEERQVAGAQQVIRTGDAPSQTAATLRYCGAQPVSGGENGDWGGAKPRCEAWAAISGLCCSSSKRSRRLTASGGVSDHWEGSTTAYATDLPTTPPAGDEPARKMAEAIGVQGYRGGQWLNVTIGGYRYQLGWRVQGHYDHIHAGVRRV